MLKYEHYWSKKMDFLYLFNLLDFDSNGQVRETSDVDLNHAKSNYLYLLSKYNQKLLEDGEKIPEFFKTELQNVLTKVENGADFGAAKAKVLENCKKPVQILAQDGKSDKVLVGRLNRLIIAKNEAQKDLGKAINNKQVTYILTQLSNKSFDAAVELQAQGELDAKGKSNLFKNVINYNAFTTTAAMVERHELSKEDLTKQA